MALSLIPIYTNYSIPVGTNAGVNPAQINIGTGGAGAGLLFNFILNSGSISPGTNPALSFRYGFSINAYTGSTIVSTLGFSALTFPLRVPTAINTTFDITYRQLVPIMGPYLYCWLESRNFNSSTTTITAQTATLAASGTFNMDFSTAVNSQYVPLISTWV